jgi:hypothetical protein
MTAIANRRTALLAVAGLLAAAGGCANTGAGDRSADGPPPGGPARANTVGPTSTAEPSQREAARRLVRLTTAPGMNLSSARQADAIRGAEGFGVSLTRWLYGDRKRLDVEPVTVAARSELASAPPYIPLDQRGTGEGRVQLLELALQTGRSGIVTVTIKDVRTTYRISAALELRGGRWQIVHVNTH